MFGVASTVRANLPSVYAFSLVRPPPPKIATDAGPCSARSAASRVATTPSASSQLTARSSPSTRSRGVVRRSGVVSREALVQPFWHRPPRLVGKSRPVTVTGGPSGEVLAARPIAHCSAQYGQWVAVPAGSAGTAPGDPAATRVSRPTQTPICVIRAPGRR